MYDDDVRVSVCVGDMTYFIITLSMLCVPARPIYSLQPFWIQFFSIPSLCVRVCALAAGCSDVWLPFAIL